MFTSLFVNSQEALTFADSSTLSNALFDDSQNPQSALSQATGVVDEIFLTLDNAFSEELNNNNEWNIDRNDIKNWETCDSDVRTNMVGYTFDENGEWLLLSRERKSHPSDLNESAAAGHLTQIFLSPPRRSARNNKCRVI
jgi:hypothetical protein